MCYANAMPGCRRWVFAVPIALVIGVRFAEPIQDGDLFWHLAYARQMLDRGTLHLDHAAFSWMPATTEVIYCSWLSELGLYALHERVGPWAIFALRHLVLAAVAYLAWAQACRLGIAGSVLVPLVVLVLVLGSYFGSLPKPELCSLLGTSLLAFLLFRVKREADAARAARYAVAIPLLVLLWVNLHGGVFLALLVLTAAIAGEAANRRWSPGVALPAPVFRRLVVASALALPALAMTPYGVAYPRQTLADFVLTPRVRPDFAWNAAHLPLTARVGSPLHLEELGVIMIVTLLGLGGARAARAAAGARIDWMVVLVNAVAVPFFFVWSRTTFLWPAVFAPSAIMLLADVRALGAARPAWPAAWPVREACVAVFVYLTAIAVYGAWARPFGQSWLGYGIGYVNPVVEAEYVARHRLGPRLYNVGDAGGYLLWRLGPDVQVMADSRSFPFLSWFDEHHAFIHGRDFEGFTTRYPADAAVIDLDKPLLLERFLAAPQWRLAFYGPTSAVFVPAGREVPPIDADLATRFAHLRNAGTALRVLAFAERVGDAATADEVRRQLAGPLRIQASWHGAPPAS